MYHRYYTWCSGYEEAVLDLDKYRDPENPDAVQLDVNTDVNVNIDIDTSKHIVTAAPAGNETPAARAPVLTPPVGAVPAGSLWLGTFTPVPLHPLDLKLGSTQKI